MSRRELAEAANDYVWNHSNGKQRTTLSDRDIGRYERYEAHWPDEWRRLGLRGVLGVSSDAELGFYPNRKTATLRVTATDDRPRPQDPDADPTISTSASRPAACGWDDGNPRSGSWKWAAEPGAEACPLPVPSLLPTSVVEQKLPTSSLLPVLLDQDQEAATDRRQFLGGALGVSGLALTGISDSAMVSDHADQPQAKPATRVDPALVDHFAALRSMLVDLDNRLGAAWVLPTVQHQLAMIAQLRRRTRGPLHDLLLSTESRWAEFAGWLSDDLGNHAAGAWWLSQALSMAQEANDLDFSAFLFARMAQRASVVNEQDRVAGLARAAVNIETTHPRVRAFASLQRAHGHALEGEIREFESAVDHARALVESNTAPPDDLGSFCTIPYVLAQQADGLLHLGETGPAVQRLSQALAMWPESYPRDRGLYLSRAAAAHLANQQPDQAAALALEALELADATRSTRIGHQVASLSLQLRKFGDRPTTARLVEALNESTLVTT